MKTLLTIGFVAIAALGASSYPSPVLEDLAVGTEAPALNARTWFNHIGRPLEIANLGGNAVLVEFWATW